MINPIQKMYEKITDDVYDIGFNVKLRFNVALAKKQADGTRYHYHQEYKYSTNKYIDTNSVITMRRSFDFYLSIENLKEIDNIPKEFIMIRVQDIMNVQMQFRNATNWFNGDMFPNLFAYDENKKLRMLGKPKDIIIRNLALDKFIILQPVIIRYDDTNETMGVRMYLNSYSNFVDINIDRFMGLVYLLNTINMYQSAQLLVNYLQRPDLGEGLHQYNSFNDIPEQIEDGKVETNIKGRTVTSKSAQKSFFDKIGEL